MLIEFLEELCVIAMNGLARAGLITMDEASCIESTEAGRLMSLYYLDLETMKHIMKIQGDETLERLLWIICESHELSDMHLRTDERRNLNALNRNNSAATIRFPLKGKITTRQMKLSCMIQAILGCLHIPDPSLHQEAMKIMRIADRICKCLVAYATRPEPISQQLKYFAAVLNSIILAKCVASQLWENSPYVSKQLKGIGPTFSTLLATAGKVNFMLLEESHPRDLERIMNKGAPAGNILRKQISLLPKYQLTTTPIDEMTVSVKLLLLNQTFLSENMEHLTAGATHKCYVVVGDSENHILMLRTFTDKDLISVYDGSIEYKITRKHNFEHYISVHCISSKFAGVDVQCVYTFTRLISANSLAIVSSNNLSEENNINNEQTIKQSNVTSTVKERKRKNCGEEIAQSKEKKKRDNALAEKIKLLKESFGRTSSYLKRDLQEAQEISNDVVNDNVQYEDSINVKVHLNANTKSNELDPETTLLDDNIDDFMDDTRINSILNEIESEITNSNTIKRTQFHETHSQTPNCDKKDLDSFPIFKINNSSSRQLLQNRRVKNTSTRSNYKFMELLEKNRDLSDDEVTPGKDCGFSDTIKSHIEKYILNSCKQPNSLDLTLKELSEKNQSIELRQIVAKNKDESPSDNAFNTIIETIQCADSVNEHDNNVIISVSDDNQNKTIDDSVDKNKMVLTSRNDLTFDPFPLSTIQVKKSVNTTQNLETTSGEDLFPEFDNTDRRKGEGGRKEPNCDIENEFLKTDTLLDNTQGSIKFHNDNNLISNPCHSNISYTNIATHFTNVDSSLLNFKTTPTSSFDNANELPSSVDKKLTKDIDALPKHEHSVLLDQNISLSSTHKTTLSAKQSISSNDIILPPPRKLTIANTDTYLAINKLPIPSIKTPTLPLYSINASSLMPSLTQSQNFTINNTRSYIENQNKNIFITPYEDSKTGKGTEKDIVDINYYKNEPSYSNLKNARQDSSVDANNHERTVNSEMNSIGNNEYEESYSISAEKVDIQTKFTNDQKIRVIRRLKVDLDVRKIVSSSDKENKNIHETGVGTSRYTKENENIEGCNNQQSVNQLDTKLDTLLNKQILPTNDPCNEKSEQRMDTHLKLQISALPEGDERSERKDINNDQTTNTEKEKIANIFQKYKNIIGTNKNNDPKFINTKSSNVYHKTKPKPFKPNRPFKISDIHHVNLPLPSLNCGDVKCTTTTNIVIPRHEDPKYTNSIMNIIIGNISTNQITNDDKDNLNKYFELTPNQSPTPSLGQPLEISEKDFQIDQSMFNPKALLQSLNNKDDDVDIIPPPPEFRNDVTFSSYSPETSDNFNTNELMADMDYPSQSSIFNEILEKSVVEDNSEYGVDLTPSREIETWTLTRDEAFETNLSQTSIMQAYTTIHNPMYNNFPSNTNSQNISTRQGKLKAFKFNSKSKLKL